MSHMSHKLIRTVKVKLTRDGRKEYFGTDKCVGTLNASVYEEYFKVLGSALIAIGACPVLINADEFYLFEENEVEVG